MKDIVGNGINFTVEANDMLRFISIFFVTAVLGLLVPGQTANKDKTSVKRPDFSGTWIIDKEKSYSKSEDRKNVSNYTLIIVHSGEELKISRNYTIKNAKSSYTETLYTDKRAEKNVDTTGMILDGEIKSKTSWKKQTVYRRFLYDRSRSGMPAYIASNENYDLSKDGKLLTVTVEYDLSSTNSEIGRAAIQQNGYSIPKRQLFFNKQE